ncbi:unnamed protein product [Leptidea sinapis]|uniref:Uncharacterized protein n=1 Tax=Leptidea sinapis TaxID=189913 RepID=A0A5E4Q4E6_9NEOP|nr:unnamed protein product [Leptidea sinapis]
MMNLGHKFELHLPYLTEDISTPRKARSEAEIMNDVLKSLKDANVDPLKECCQGLDDTSTEEIDNDKYVNGVLIFVHGNPCEEFASQEMSYSIGKALNIPTVNVDICICDALCICQCPARTIILSAINELYNISYKKLEDNSEECAIEEAKEESDDVFDVVWKKLEFLASNKNMNTPRSRASEKKKKKSPTSSVASQTALTAIGSTTMFHMDLVQELLIEYFQQPKFNRGFVVDTLTSLVIKTPSLVLTTILNVKNSIWNVHLVLCHSDFSKWAQSYEESQKEHDIADENTPKCYDENEIEDIIESLDEMDAEEYENANPELKSIYIRYGLEERRKKFHERHGFSPELEFSKQSKTLKDSKSLLMIDNESKKKIKKEDIKGKISQYAYYETNKY